MRIVYLLLHDFRFASMGLHEFAYGRFHFSKEYARRLGRLGHEVKLYVLSEDVSRKEVLQMDGYELKAFRASVRLPPHMRFGNDHSLPAIQELDRDSPDLVHFHNYYLWSFPYVAPWVRRRRTPLVAQYHGSDPIRRLKVAAYYPSLMLCDRILVPLKSEENLLKKRLGIPARRVTRFPSTGVDTQVFRPVCRKSDELILLYSGRVPMPASYLWEKAPQHLIPIVRALLDLGLKPRLVVVGDGPGLPELKAAAQRLGVQDSVDFLGMVEHEGLPELYSRATLTFVPFQMEEIGPYWDGALQESLACGTPVVAFNNESPGIKQWGLLVPTRPREAARLIAEALDNESWLSSVSRGGPRLIAENCEWTSMARRLDSTYAELTGGRR